MGRVLARLSVVWACGRSAPKGLVAEQVVVGIVHSKAKIWEQNERANVVVTEDAAPRHGAMLAQGVERSTETGDVEGIADDDDLAVE